MPTHLLYGDSFLVLEALRQLEADSGAEALLEANRHHLRGGQVNPAELLSICAALPFMDSRRLVVVDGLLSTLEPRTGRGRRRARDPQQAPPLPAAWRDMVRGLPEIPETTVLVFVDGPLSDPNPLLRLLRPMARVRHITPPEGEPLRRWIKETAREKGTGIVPGAIRRLADLVGNDLWTLDRELEKLALYAFGRSIQEDDVNLLVSQVREASVFAAVDAMLEGRPRVALDLLHRLRQEGQNASYVIAMVQRQLRLVALARDSMDKGEPRSALGARLGTSREFVLRKTAEQARRHSLQDIAGRYHRLLEADLAVKQGRLDPDLALELLAADQAPGAAASAYSWR